MITNNRHSPIMYAVVALADEITDGWKLTLSDGVYTKRRSTSLKRVGQLLEKLSRKYHLLATAARSPEEDYKKNCILSEAGWELVAPGGMRAPDGIPCDGERPCFLSLYGYPLKKGEKLPPIPPELCRVPVAQRRFMAYYFRKLLAVKFGLDD